MKNPFALVVLAAQKVAISNKLSDEELNKQRLTIARTLIEGNLYDEEKTQRFLSFLKNFIYISNKEINSNFDKQVNSLTNKIVAMNIYEAINYINREEGAYEATERIITNIIVKFGYSDEQIAAMTEAPLDTIESIRKKLNR